MKRSGPIKRVSRLKNGQPLRRRGWIKRTVVAVVAPIYEWAKSAADEVAGAVAAPAVAQPSRRRLRPRSVQQAERQRHWNIITANKVAAGQCCCRCGTRGRPGNRLTGHHHLPTGRGGEWAAGNHLLMCEACQREVHAHTEQATADGWLLTGHRPIAPAMDKAPSQRGASC